MVLTSTAEVISKEITLEFTWVENFRPSLRLSTCESISVFKIIIQLKPLLGATGKNKLLELSNPLLGHSLWGIGFTRNSSGS